MNIQDVVYEVLVKDLGVRKDKVRPESRLVKDLRIHSDNLTFIFVPELERRLGVSVPPQEWSEVFTVADAIKTLERHATGILRVP